MMHDAADADVGRFEVHCGASEAVMPATPVALDDYTGRLISD
jgi:hypothetical protein